MNDADVIVVGGGFCGLSAAEALCGSGLDVLVLEACDRVGGRVESIVNGLGERVDTGGQFLCDDMPEVMALARRHGKTLVDTRTDGEAVAQPPMPAARFAASYGGSMALREKMNAIEPDDPSIAALSVGAWLAEQDEPADVKAAFHSMIEGLWCQPIDVVPLWHLIDNDRRVTNEVTELQYLLGETMHSLADDLAGPLGDRLRLGTTVTAIERRDDGVIVQAGDRNWRAGQAIVALPPSIAARVDYAPALPPTLSRALSAWRSGTVIKGLLRYRRAFWRDSGRSGMVMWREPHGLFVCDASRDLQEPALVVFVGGPLALAWHRLAPAALRAEIVSRVVAALGAEASAFLDFTLREWTEDPFSGGGYSDIVVDMNARNAESEIRAGAGRVQFACSEVALSFPGYVEGAIVAGRAAAARTVAVNRA